MKEKTLIRHKAKNGDYCTETLYKEFWGNDDYRMTCDKCGFAKIVNVEIFLKWQYCDECDERNE